MKCGAILRAFCHHARRDASCSQPPAGTTRHKQVLAGVITKASWTRKPSWMIQLHECEGRRFSSRPPGRGPPGRPEGGQGGGERKNRGDEPSAIITNVGKAQRLSMKDMLAIKDKPALYVKEDGSKEERTVQQILDEAAQRDLDPVLVSAPNAPLVLKLMDANKTRHDLAKKKRESAKSNTGQKELKELRFGLKIDQNDLKTKMRQACTFLEKGHRVKIFMIMKGGVEGVLRIQSQATGKLDEIAALVSEWGVQDGKPQISGHVISTLIAPKPRGSGAKTSGINKKEKNSTEEDVVGSNQKETNKEEEACSAADVENQGKKVRGMKEAIKADAKAFTKEELEQEIEHLKALKARQERLGHAA